MAKTIQDNCVYCDQFTELTEDHVVPKCLFPTGRPNDMPKGYAYKACNNEEKSVNDTYLRDFLLLDMDSAEYPIPQQFIQKFARAVHLDQSIFAHHAMRSQLVELITPSGLFTGYAFGVKLPEGRIVKELTTIVCGLYHAYLAQACLKPPRLKFSDSAIWTWCKGKCRCFCKWEVSISLSVMVAYSIVCIGM